MYGLLKWFGSNPTGDSVPSTILTLSRVEVKQRLLRPKVDPTLVGSYVRYLADRCYIVAKITGVTTGDEYDEFSYQEPMRTNRYLIVDTPERCTVALYSISNTAATQGEIDMYKYGEFVSVLSS